VPYFFAQRSGDHVDIVGTDARHLSRSLRARPGEVISVVEPAGLLLAVRLEIVRDELVRGRVESEAAHRPEPEVPVTVAVAMLPAAGLELVLSRCTEAGTAGFVLVDAARSVARGSKPERWAAICREAAMLAGRLLVPPVVGPVPFARAWAEAERPWLLDRGGEPLDRLREPGTLFIGPEGGWSPAERAAAAGRVVSLGPRNLRADTAALVALTLALGPG
jgi:16S rRNA (uracil1498-N3)-methyltransferase